MGDFRKYPYHTMDGFNILTPPPPPRFCTFQKSICAPCPQIIVTLPSPVQIFHLFVKPHGIPAVSYKQCSYNLAYFMPNYYKRLLLFSIHVAGYRGGSHYTYVSRNSCWNENEVFSLLLFNR